LKPLTMSVYIFTRLNQGTFDECGIFNHYYPMQVLLYRSVRVERRARSGRAYPLWSAIKCNGVTTRPPPVHRSPTTRPQLVYHSSTTRLPLAHHSSTTALVHFQAPYTLCVGSSRIASEPFVLVCRHTLVHNGSMRAERNQDLAILRHLASNMCT
jgi:hypothetical protein